MAVVKNITWKRGSNIISPIILRLSGKISNGEGNGNFGEENQDLKKMMLEKNIKLLGT